MTALNERQTRLLVLLKGGRRVITTGRVHEVNRQLGAPKRTTARRDIAVFQRHGLLTQGGSDGRRFYLLTRKAGDDQ
ncbi:hypothetical protein [Streptomyces sp. KN37]|uniref:hypothetical protein n=1 Tax=Streptomyces sp. KN37 TaxID=3090667 RepID=UPI002A752C3D|nr:hypothetical protein [Streptomyces sp. KN37]WPO70254.1 hypothetical protein R9806_06225 [Streptomyces sp. KN37]WPO73976.1 hypothetical protein R9806_26840 [Streptomyces sp. KN37]